MNISVVLGTGRSERKSELVSKTLCEMLQQHDDVVVTHVDVRDHVVSAVTTRVGEADSSEWKTVAEASDGFIFVLPEYNHGYPGEWKLLMDSLYKAAFEGKVAGLVGVSSGQFGGVRAVELATLSLATRGMMIMKDTLHFPHVADLFDTNGVISDQAQAERVNNFLGQYRDMVVKYSK